MKIIVGLGNYGDKYAYNYHNMGFLVAECLADRFNLKFSKRECSSMVAVGQHNGEKLVVAKPLTYMNLSGKAVKELLGKFDADVNDLIVVFDDVDIDFAAVRVRLEGSGGTHNGMRNIIELIGSKQFKRVRVGVGRPPENVPLADFVLSDVPRGKRQQLADAIELAADEVEKLI